MNHLLRILWTLVLPLMAVAPTAAAISGSFIQPWLVADWDDARWQQEYAMLSEAGIHRLIFMHTVHTDKEGKAQAVYPTRIEGIAPAQTTCWTAACAMHKRRGSRSSWG